MIALADQIKEIEREIALRKAVYPKFVASGRMKQADADEHLRRIDAVRGTLVWLQQNEPAIRVAWEREKFFNPNTEAPHGNI